MTDPKYTHIVLVLDRSGSMSSIRNDTIGGINTFLTEQRKLPDNCTFTLHQFDDSHEYTHRMQSMRLVPDLTTETYVPRGMTALYDAIGIEIAATGKVLAEMPENKRPGKVLFVIMTDGEENKSQEFNQQTVAELITRQRDTYHWDFVFMGANQDSYGAAKKIAIPTTSTMNFGASARGMWSGTQSLNKMATNYRNAPIAAASASAAFDAEDKQWQKDAGVDNKP